MASTTSVHPLSDNHISLNQNGLAIQGSSKLFGMIHKGLWSKEITLLARALFNLSQIEWPSTKCFSHINWEPTNPRSIKPHPSTASLNSCIYACERPRPRPFCWMLGQTYVNGWSHVIVSQNGGSTDYFFL